MKAWEALKLARRKCSWYSVFAGSAATASVNSCAAFSHCCAVSYFKPFLKCESPFLAITVNGINNRQQAKSSETNARILIVDLISSLSQSGVKIKQRDYAAKGSLAHVSYTRLDDYGSGESDQLKAGCQCSALCGAYVYFFDKGNPIYLMQRRKSGKNLLQG